jgi:tRNA nucleotidyltransferase (CCA-adding enzyme)
MEETHHKKEDEIFKRVIKIIKPSNVEIQTTIANTNKIMQLLKGIVGKDVEIKVTGSISKGTNLKGNADIDMFMLFNKKINKNEMVKKGLLYAKTLSARRKHTRYEVKYAEHPYTRVYLDDLNIKLDLVPAYKLNNIKEIGTAVDRTPLHTEFINKNLNDKQRDDVRLLKYFLKMHNLYGAEVRIKGFSGYLCELLVYTFGSINRVIDYFANTSIPIHINCINKKTEVDPLLEKKFNSQFIVIDPTDENRNVAAAVSEENLAKFIILCKSFVSNPDIRMFYEYGIDINKSEKLLNNLISKMHSDVYLCKMKVSDKSEDTVWPQLNRFSNILENEISKEEFKIFVSCSWIKKNYGYILYLAKKEYNYSKLIKGPNAYTKNYSVEFIKQHKDAFGFIVKNENIYAISKSKYTSIDEVINKIIFSDNKFRSKDIDLKTFTVTKKIPKNSYIDAYSSVINKIII